MTTSPRQKSATLFADAFRACWRLLKEMSGDNNYGRYLARSRTPDSPTLSAEQFYLQQLRRKYSRINRCC